MKVLFYGDSITDAGRDFAVPYGEASYGYGYVKYAAAGLKKRGLTEEEIVNRGISGNRIVDLYARIKVDCWNHNPDLLSILIGVNDVWHEIDGNNGVELDRFEKMYRILIEDTKKVLPNLKILLCEPFILDGIATTPNMDQFKAVYDYAKVVKKLAEEYGLYYLPLQETLKKAAVGKEAEYLNDGVHPAEAGAKLIANEWLKAFDEINIEK
ncbi:MAG: SGNH/GDSL hydrolase family protein [Clostridia bacterium]|nr:SGNH/GDSL hydrolase family protein [Clostridia bacterium]